MLGHALGEAKAQAEFIVEVFLTRVRTENPAKES